MWNNAPEKSNFARRCNLLSQYLKQNGSFGGIDLGLTRKPDSDLGLTGKPDFTGQQKSETSEIKPIDFFCGKSRDADFSEPSRVLDRGASQMTIFFNGKVIVFNEFPADKAKELMEMAKQAKPETASDLNRKNQLKGDDDDNNSCSSKGNMVIPDLNAPTSSGDGNEDQTRQKNQSQNQLVDRIARRASLHRFFAKRKDRAAARAPYQANQNAGHPPPKPEMPSPLSSRGQTSGQAANNSVLAANPLLNPKGHQQDNKPSEEEKEEESGKCLKDLELRL